MTAQARQGASSRVAGWTDPAFARVADVVHVIAGLVFPPNRQPSAESGMRRAMTSLRIRDPDALGVAVQHPGEARDAVLAELTVGETYFFRESAQLDVLGERILPSLVDDRGPGVPLRIWSAGCASGEEPYSLAIMLRELGWPHPARILGTDVARPRLEAARRAHYTRWSLRGAAPERVERWFERRTSHFVLHPDIRGAVEFAKLNLIADDYPSAATGTQDQDIVLCRNVLIYFDMESVALIATRLLAALAPGGWLLLGASDPPLTGLVPCEVVMTPGGVVYRRADRAPSPPPPGGAPMRITGPTGAHPRTSPATPPSQAPTPSPTPSLSALSPLPDVAVTVASPAPPVIVVSPPRAAKATSPTQAAYAAAAYDDAETRARADIAADPGVLDGWIVLVRSLANQGRLRQADEECMRALDHHRDAPELHYLHAMLLSAAGQLRESTNASRRALYVDRHFTMAQMQLGDALAQLGERERATRAFENVILELADVPDECPVPAADGVSASRLRQSATIRLRRLRDGSAS
jgi:chemotaxis protein methyltransferase CheR